MNDDLTTRQGVLDSVRREFNSLVNAFAVRWSLRRCFVYSQVYNTFLESLGLIEFKEVLYSYKRKLDFFLERDLLIKLLIFAQKYLYQKSVDMEHYFEVVMD